MKGFVPKPAPQGHRWVKGQSGNPKGRPPGRVDARTKITRALLDDAPAVARVVIDAALEGDLQAASLVLARVAPALRQETYPVQFPFDPSAPIAQQIEQVLAAMAGGVVAPDVGKLIIESIGTLSNARAVEELEARIMTLEAKQV
jgi:hypothetical protein